MIFGRCPNCGEYLGRYAGKHCPHCGKHFGRSEGEYCQHCGNPIED